MTTTGQFRISTGAGGVHAAVVALGVRSTTSKFEDLIMFGSVDRYDQKVYFSHILAWQTLNPSYTNVWKSESMFSSLY